MEKEMFPVVPKNETPADKIIAEGPAETTGEGKLITHPDGTTQWVGSPEEEREARKTWHENQK